MKRVITLNSIYGIILTSICQPSLVKLNGKTGTLGTLLLLASLEAVEVVEGNSSIRTREAQHFRNRSEVMAVNVDSCVKNTRLSEAKSTSFNGSYLEATSLGIWRSSAIRGKDTMCSGTLLIELSNFCWGCCSWGCSFSKSWGWLQIFLNVWRILAILSASRLSKALRLEAELR